MVQSDWQVGSHSTRVPSKTNIVKQKRPSEPALLKQRKTGRDGSHKPLVSGTGPDSKPRDNERNAKSYPQWDVTATTEPKMVGVVSAICNACERSEIR